MISIKDIARETGFSITTVSRALNDFQDVSKNTKNIIKQKAKELNYVPNVTAKHLVNKNTKTIGFIINKFLESSLLDNFAIRLFLGMTYANDEYEIILIHYREDNPKKFSEIVSNRQLSAAIIFGFDATDPFVIDAIHDQTPVVLIDIKCDNETTSYVMSDVVMAFNLLMSLTIRHEDIKKITFIVGSTESYVTEIWMSCVRKFVKENSERYTFSIINGEYKQNKAYKEVQKVINNGEIADIFICFSDVMAIGTLEALKKSKINVPEDCYITGYDDITVSRYISPALTTVAQQPENLGKSAINTLVSIIDGRPFGPIKSNVNLVVRETMK